VSEPTVWFVLVGVFLIAVSLPMLLRRVPPNALYGLRVPATFKNEQVWYDANAASGRDMVVFGLIVVLFGFMPPRFGWSGETHWLAWSLVVGGGAVVTAMLGWQRANRMLKARFEEARKEG